MFYKTYLVVGVVDMAVVDILDLNVEHRRVGLTDMAIDITQARYIYGKLIRK